MLNKQANIGRCRHFGLLRQSLAALLVFTFLIKGLVPAGYMPDFGRLRQGVVAITICTGSSVKQILVDENGKPVESRHQAGLSDICAFGALPQVAVLADASLPLGYFAPLPEINFNRREFILAELAYSPAQPRAPPLA